MTRSFLSVAVAAALLLVPAPAAQAAAGNHKPAVPASIRLSGVDCTSSGAFIGITTAKLTATLADPDFGGSRNETVTATFALWPIDRPAERVQWDSAPASFAGAVSSTGPATLVNSVRYRLVARATDAAGAVSRWSTPCQFTVDTRVPHAPSVSSPEYPSAGSGGGVGVTGRFTFSATGGDTDVVKFRYSARNAAITEVPADRNGRAVIEYTPTSPGWDVMLVHAIDRAGNLSAETRYELNVLNLEPYVDDLNPDGGVGDPRTIGLGSFMPGLASFTYRLNDGPAVTVPADEEGRATVIVTPDRRGDNILTVTGRTSSGEVTPTIEAVLYVKPQVAQPTITSPDFPGDGSPLPLIGQEVTVVFTAQSPDVAEFTWSTDFGQPAQVVAAGPDGTATIRYTSRDASFLLLMVRARTADGFTSSLTTAGWDLTSHAPMVESAQYPLYGSNSGPGEFTFRPAHDGVTGYEYTFNDGETRIVEGETATIAWTPDSAGSVTLKVREHVGGIVSDATEYIFRVTE